MRKSKTKFRHKTKRLKSIIKYTFGSKCFKFFKNIYWHLTQIKIMYKIQNIKSKFYFCLFSWKVIIYTNLLLKSNQQCTANLYDKNEDVKNRKVNVPDKIRYNSFLCFVRFKNVFCYKVFKNICQVYGVMRIFI